MGPASPKGDRAPKGDQGPSGTAGDIFVGNTMIGELAMSNHKITGLAEGTYPADVIRVSQLGESRITNFSTISMLQYVMENASNVSVTDSTKLTVEDYDQSPHSDKRAYKMKVLRGIDVSHDGEFKIKLDPLNGRC